MPLRRFRLFFYSLDDLITRFCELPLVPCVIITAFDLFNYLVSSSGGAHRLKVHRVSVVLTFRQLCHVGELKM